MKNMTAKQERLCHAIIHTASASAGAVGAGLAQIPLSDRIIIAPIQLMMTVALGKVFDLEFTKSAAKAAIASGASVTVGRTVSQVAVGWIPVTGNVVNATTAAAVTEALGWMLAEDFAKQASKSKVKAQAVA